MKQLVSVKSVTPITHDVLQIVTEKPEDFNYHPGQATEVFINKEGWLEAGRPFTFTSLPSDDFLEFTIKTYPSKKGVTNQLLLLKQGDELFLNDIFGDIGYKDEGLFIAGGAGITPFISIFRQLEADHEIGNNKLIFANNTKADIIHEKEFRELLGENFINILAKEKTNEYASGYITKDFLKKYISESTEYYYLCGPPPMMDAVENELKELNVHSNLIIKESF